MDRAAAPEPATWLPRAAATVWSAARRVLGYRDDRVPDRADYQQVQQDGAERARTTHGGPDADMSIRRRSTSGTARPETVLAATLGRTLSPAMERDELAAEAVHYGHTSPVYPTHALNYGYVPQQDGTGTFAHAPAPAVTSSFGGFPGYAVASYDMSSGLVTQPSYGYGVMDEEDEKQYNGGSLYDE
jgi:hypothetical protein